MKAKLIKSNKEQALEVCNKVESYKDIRRAKFYRSQDTFVKTVIGMVIAHMGTNKYSCELRNDFTDLHTMIYISKSEANAIDPNTNMGENGMTFGLSLDYRKELTLYPLFEGDFKNI